MKNLILIGAGGHCKSCIDVIEEQGEYKILGLIDLKEKIGTEVLGYKVLDCDENIQKYINNETYFLITLGQIHSYKRRADLFKDLKSSGAKFATVVSPRAYLSKHATVGEGTIIMHSAIVNSSAVVGENCIINTKSLIEHDCFVGKNCHISTCSVLNGGAKVYDNSFVGSNATVVQGVTVKEGAFIKAGSLVK